jgi:hypothetical protein
MTHANNVNVSINYYELINGVNEFILVYQLSIDSLLIIFIQLLP